VEEEAETAEEAEEAEEGAVVWVALGGSAAGAYCKDWFPMSWLERSEEKSAKRREAEAEEAESPGDIEKPSM